MFEGIPDIFDVKVLAEALGVGMNTAYELIRSGKIESVRVGKQIRISKVALLEFMKCA